MHTPFDARTNKQHAFTALNQRRWPDALSCAMHALKHDGSDAEANFIAGIALLEQQKILDAVKYLKVSASLSPQNPDFHLGLARASASAQDYASALGSAETAEQLLPDDNAFGFDTLGVIFTQCHAHERAANAFRLAVTLMPGNAGFHFNLGTALTFTGDLVAAEKELERCVELNPRHWRAHHSLSHIRRQTKSSNHIEKLSLLAQKATGEVTATTYLNMALSKEWEDLGDHDRSFEHCIIGKSAPRHLIRYSRERESRFFAALSANFPTHFKHETIDEPAGEGPIFIAGMPRTGTTLVDRIVSSHPLVQSAGELHNFPSAWKRALGGSSFEMFNAEQIAAATDIDWSRLGEDYISSTRAFAGTKPFFTDKLPHNFLYLGYIACALPNAKIICVRRNPMDTCLSNFRQLFAPESPYFDYSYDILDVGHYYILFDQLMRHWKNVFPNRIFEIQYESLVNEQEKNSRRLIEHCGLEWNEACLHFEKNTAPVSTASAVQVRAPMYTSSLNRWRRYETQLKPLEQMLRDAGTLLA